MSDILEPTYLLQKYGRNCELFFAAIFAWLLLVMPMVYIDYDGICSVEILLLTDSFRIF